MGPLLLFQRLDFIDPLLNPLTIEIPLDNLSDYQEKGCMFPIEKLRSIELQLADS
jgi:hypothetical protein